MNTTPYLPVGQTVSLHSGEVRRTFTVEDRGGHEEGRWYFTGGSAVCYDAFFTDGDGIRHHGKLKKFRAGASEEGFREQAADYIAPYQQLMEAVSPDRGADRLLSFIPSFEIYYDPYGCPYIWTPQIPMLTFQEVCRKLANGTESVEDALYEIAAALRSLTDCIRILHQQNLIHGDINPSNFGFYYREENILAEGVSLFDLNTLRRVTDEPRFYTPPYYSAAPDEGDWGNRADIGAIGVTLCRALLCSFEQIETIRKASVPMAPPEAGEAAADAVFSGELFVRKGIPADPAVRMQLVRVILQTVTVRANRRISSCTRLMAELRILETLLLPHISHPELSRGLGIEIVNREERRKGELKKLFLHLLYERPLYRRKPAGPEYRIAVVGFGPDAQQFLDACLQTGQAMNGSLEVQVWDFAIRAEKECYLAERPALPEFFQVDGLESRLTGEPFGRIQFRNLDSLRTAAIRDAVEEQGPFQTVYIAAGPDALNRTVARKLSALDSEGAAEIIAQCEKGASREEDGVFFLAVNTEDPGFATAGELEQMSFNTHLVWSGSGTGDLEAKRKQYGQPFYRNSCLSFALTVKYRLHTLRIDMESGLYEAAGRVRPLLRDDAEIAALALSEHRRWVTEKICGGWTRMPVEDVLNYYDSKDIAGKRHVCLVRSDAEPLLGRYRDVRWDRLDEETLGLLDEYDRVSVGIHCQYMKGLQLYMAGSLPEPHAVNSILYHMRDWPALQQLFLEWHDLLCDIFQRLLNDTRFRAPQADLSLYERAYRRLAGEIDALEDPPARGFLRGKVDAVYRSFIPAARCLQYTDYKQINFELIRRIPFILTWRDNLELIVPVPRGRLLPARGKTGPSELFSWVSAALVLNPRKLYLVAGGPAEPDAGEREDARRKLDAVHALFRRKGLQTAAQLVFGSEADLLRGLREANPDGWLLVRSRKPQDAGEKTGAFFPAAGKPFETSPNAAWINDVPAGSSLDARDIAVLLGKQFRLRPQPFFRREDYRFLYSQYRSCGRSTWKALCRLLMPYEMARIGDISPQRSFRDRSGTDWPDDYSYYYFPAECFDALRSILEQLQKAGIAGEKSALVRPSVRECELILQACSGWAQKDLDSIFTRLSSLPAAGRFELREDLSIQCGEDRVIPLPTISADPDRVLHGISRSIPVDPAHAPAAEAVARFLKKQKLAHSCTHWDKKSTPCVFSIAGYAGGPETLDRLFDPGFLASLPENPKLRLVRAGWSLWADTLAVPGLDLAGLKPGTREKAAGILEKLRGRGYIHMAENGDTVDIAFGSSQIKGLFMAEGSFLENYIYHLIRETPGLDSAAAGFVFVDPKSGMPENEIDCMAIHRFRSVLVECKSRHLGTDPESLEAIRGWIKKLRGEVDRFAVNGFGILVLDTDVPLPDLSRDGILVLSGEEDILRIGEIIRDRLLPEPRLQESPAGEDPSAAESPDPGPGASGIPGDESRPTQFRSPPQSCQ